MTCVKCAELTRECAYLRQMLDRIGDVIVGDDAISGRLAELAKRPAIREYNTEHGRVIAAECSRLGLSLAEVSVACGYSDDYLARVCRGSLPLVRSCAVRVGDKLGVSLGGFVDPHAGRAVRAPRKPKGEQPSDQQATPAPSLPGVIEREPYVYTGEAS